ncbi:uncharacterized protein PHALS_03817 [Plasmopara halstedii]|uniref:Uncharacterized protein n=1 Tax=Plasmopara halstedii TaxID=4781 RepID=A0A0P1AZ66_PLAHL|nr:uncharacterized protein PHALS_03817 [Plasmopara halstedii]CEG47168.1 hypothetical protein PHALS_03817 [Plasmopara halstedii]|eukprot:XP_024583537.1 hypothetical protein PHALS_03817 [Plasmopara halstedii]
MTNDENRDDIALVMSLLLYDQRENQIQQERQCALEVERTKRNKNIPLSVVEQERCQDEVIMVELQL